LDTEGGAEDGEQHGRVAAENRTAVDGQYRYRYRCVAVFAQREAYL
jgi:hypothetical protein